MRILQISTIDEAGGAEAAALDLHRMFRELGHDSILVVGTKRSQEPGIVELGPLSPRYSPGWALRGVGRRIGLQYVGGLPGGRAIADRAVRWDAAIAHNLHGGYVDLRCVPYLATRAPMALMMQDMWLLTGHCAHAFSCERWMLGCGSCPNLSIYPAVSRDATHLNHARKRRLLARSPIAITSPGAWLLKLVEASYLASKPRRLIPNPVSQDVFHPADRKEARHHLGLPVDRHIVLYPALHGFTNPFKAPDLIVASLRLLDDLDPIVVTFGGHAIDPGHANVVVKKPAHRQQMARFYAAADVVAYPTRADTSPLGIIEAMATGRPVVGTDVGGVPELVRDGVTGSVCPPGEAEPFASAIRRMLESPEMSQRMGEAALHAVKDHHLSVVAAAWIEWFGELAQVLPGRETRR